MGARERYEPGTFCWIDLETDDARAAKAFYVGLFGWATEDTPISETMVYTMCSVDGRHVCAMYDRGGRPEWLSYISVADVDAVAAKAREAGAASVADPFDVFDSGRMTVIVDPTGARVAAWQPRTHPGAGLVNGPDLWCLNQLNTSDPAAAQPFYE